jgi:hypothetical protein
MEVAKKLEMVPSPRLPWKPYSLDNFCWRDSSNCLFNYIIILGLFAIELAQQNPEVIHQLGEPIQCGWFISGSINVTGPSGLLN